MSPRSFALASLFATFALAGCAATPAGSDLFGEVPEDQGGASERGSGATPVSDRSAARPASDSDAERSDVGEAGRGDDEDFDDRDALEPDEPEPIPDTPDPRGPDTKNNRPQGYAACEPLERKACLACCAFEAARSRDEAGAVQCAMECAF